MFVLNKFFKANSLPLVVLLALLLAATLLPNFLANPNSQDLRAALAQPNISQHFFGTDELGRDVLSNILHGLRVSLLVGFAAMFISAIIGIPLGMLAGFSGGRLDAILMRAADLQFSLPTTLVSLATIAVVGASLWKLVLVIGLVGWASFARLARATTLQQRQQEYVLAAEALGAKNNRILQKQILPNILGPMLVQASLDVPQNILLEATLSFLGLGAGTNTPSLGAMVARGYQFLASGQWWLALLPGATLMLLVLALNATGDNLRDALDVRATRT